MLAVTVYALVSRVALLHCNTFDGVIASFMRAHFSCDVGARAYLMSASIIKHELERKTMAETLDVVNMLPSTFEPKRKFRWILQIEGIDAFIVKTTARPQSTIEEVEIPWINHTRYVAGKHKFAPLAVTLHDPIAPSASQQVTEWIRLHFESVSGRAGYADFYKRDIQLKMLDPVGTVVELWDIRGAFIVDANFGDLNYEGSELAEITLSLRYDNAVLQF